MTDDDDFEEGEKILKADESRPQLSAVSHVT